MGAAPHSTFDLMLANGMQIPIEQRDVSEITHVRGEAFAAPGCDALNPAFDVTPATLIDAIVTEYGVIANPNTENITRHFERYR